MDVNLYVDLRTNNVLIGYDDGDFIRDVFKVLVVPTYNGKLNITFVSLCYPLFAKLPFDIERSKDIIKINRLDTSLSSEDIELYSNLVNSYKNFLVDVGVKTLIV